MQYATDKGKKNIVLFEYKVNTFLIIVSNKHIF